MTKFLETPLTVFHVIICLVAILVILIQPGKSGGLGAAFGGAGAQQVFGGRGAGNLLTRITWISMALFFTTSISLAYMSSSGDSSLEAKSKAAQAEQEADRAPAKPANPSPPAENPAPENTPAEIP